MLIAAAVSLSSCGGLTNLGLTTNSFQGTWAGTATLNGSPGSMSLTIDANGNVTGTDAISHSGSTTTDTGSITTAGALSLTTSLNGTVAATISANVLVVSGTMTGSGTIIINGVGSTITISLASTTQ